MKQIIRGYGPPWPSPTEAAHAFIAIGLAGRRGHIGLPLALPHGLLLVGVELVGAWRGCQIGPASARAVQADVAHSA